MNYMKRLTVLSFALAATFAATAGQAAMLKYCSEGSPEGFDPGQFTSGTTMDATAQAIYNRLVQFERGGTKVVPALAESWTISPDGLQYTFKLRRGVKVHTTEYFKPTRDFNADDIVFTYERMINK
ncbi:MAG: ABC transporter substrate-binding protein, partial [Chitinimonas sp.]|nr:ABC transporter substrate-binding protein [Chitinimonas sp.]